MDRFDVVAMSAAQHNVSPAQECLLCLPGCQNSELLTHFLTHFLTKGPLLLSATLDANCDVHHVKACQWTDLAGCILFATAGH